MMAVVYIHYRWLAMLTMYNTLDSMWHEVSLVAISGKVT